MRLRVHHMSHTHTHTHTHVRVCPYVNRVLCYYSPLQDIAAAVCPLSENVRLQQRHYIPPPVVSQHYVLSPP